MEIVWPCLVVMLIKSGRTLAPFWLT